MPLVLALSLLGLASGQEGGDALDALLELAGEPVETAPVEPSRAYFGLGALLLMTSEGRFPRTFLELEDGTWQTDALLQPGETATYPSAVLAANAEWAPLDALSLRIFLTSGELRPGGSLEPTVDAPLTAFGLEPGAFLESGAWLSEASVALYLEPVTVEIGRRIAEVGSGLIYQDVGTGIFLDAQAGALGGALALFAVGRDFEALERPSPMAKATLRYDWGLVGGVELYAATFWDRDDVLTDVMAATLTEATIRSTDNATEQLLLDAILGADLGDRARTSYLGISASGLAGPIRLRGNASLSWGEFDFADPVPVPDGFTGPFGDPITTSPLQPLSGRRIALRGVAADLDAYYGFTPSLGLSLEGLYFSGYDPEELRDERYSTFIAVAPLWTYSTIFFTSGVNQSFNLARASAAGVNGHGVLGGGPSLEWAPGNALVELKALALFADAPSAPEIGGGGSFYGVETNLRTSLPLTDALRLQAIGGVLFPGDFFPVNTPAFRAVVFLDGSFES